MRIPAWVILKCLSTYNHNISKPKAFEAKVHILVRRHNACLSEPELLYSKIMFLSSTKYHDSWFLFYFSFGKSSSGMHIYHYLLCISTGRGHLRWFYSKTSLNNFKFTTLNLSFTEVITLISILITLTKPLTNNNEILVFTHIGSL